MWLFTGVNRKEGKCTKRPHCWATELQQKSADGYRQEVLLVLLIPARVMQAQAPLSTVQFGGAMLTFLCVQSTSMCLWGQHTPHLLRGSAECGHVMEDTWH